MDKIEQNHRVRFIHWSSGVTVVTVDDDDLVVESIFVTNEDLAKLGTAHKEYLHNLVEEN